MPLSLLVLAATLAAQTVDAAPAPVPTDPVPVETRRAEEVMPPAPPLEPPPADDPSPPPAAPPAPVQVAPPPPTTLTPPAPSAPAPDARDALDAPLSRTVAPDAENVPLRFDQEAPAVAAHAALNALGFWVLWAVPSAVVFAVVGGVALLPALFVPAAWPASVLFAAVVLPCLLPPFVLWGAASPAVGTIIAQFTGGRRGPLLPTVGAMMVALLPLGLAWALPPLVAAVTLAVLGGLLAVEPLSTAARGEPVEPGPRARGQAFLVLAVAHPLLAAGWALLGGLVVAGVAGSVGALTYWAMGRVLEPDEGPEVDLVEVGPRPAQLLLDPVPPSR